MAGSLEGPFAKLTRAERQIAILQKQIGDIWPPHEAWPVHPKVDRAGLEYRFYLGELPNIEPEWALIAGEIMFDLRSALDHLIFQLHVRRYRGAVPEEIESKCMFPIFYDPGKFMVDGERRIKALSERDRRAIRWLQPYITRRDKWQRTRSDLEDLDIFHNIDKHRKLHLVTGAHNAAVIPQFPPGVGFRLQPVWGRVKSKAHIETWTFAKPPPKMQDHPGAYLQVGLEYRDLSFDLLPLLKEMRAAVVQVLDRFADRFP
jgi:hypothetical protein